MVFMITNSTGCALASTDAISGLATPGLTRNSSRVVTGLLAFWLLALCCAPAAAVDWYRVEAILFIQLEPDADEEWWYENPGLPERDQTIALINELASAPAIPATEPVEEELLKPYLALPKRDYRLTGVRRALAASREYRPLMHVAWQQPGLERRDVRAIHLNNTRLEEKPAQQADVDESWEEPEYTPPVKVYDGIIRLRRSRFLHLDVDFAYFPDTLEQPDLALPEQARRHGRAPADYVRLTQSRRIKLEELNYFDHPLFGLVIEVSRLEAEEEPG